MEYAPPVRCFALTGLPFTVNLYLHLSERQTTITEPSEFDTASTLMAVESSLTHLECTAVSKPTVTLAGV